MKNQQGVHHLHSLCFVDNMCAGNAFRKNSISDFVFSPIEKIFRSHLFKRFSNQSNFYHIFCNIAHFLQSIW